MKRFGAVLCALTAIFAVVAAHGRGVDQSEFTPLYSHDSEPLTDAATASPMRMAQQFGAEGEAEGDAAAEAEAEESATEAEVDAEIDAVAEAAVAAGAESWTEEDESFSADELEAMGSDEEMEALAVEAVDEFEAEEAAFATEEAVDATDEAESAAESEADEARFAEKRGGGGRRGGGGHRGGGGKKHGGGHHKGGHKKKHHSLGGKIKHGIKKLMKKGGKGLGSLIKKGGKFLKGAWNAIKCFFGKCKKKHHGGGGGGGGGFKLPGFKWPFGGKGNNGKPGQPQPPGGPKIPGTPAPGKPGQPGQPVPVGPGVVLDPRLGPKIEKLNYRYRHQCRVKDVGRRRCRPTDAAIAVGMFSRRTCTNLDVGQNLCRRRRRSRWAISAQIKKSEAQKRAEENGPPRLPEDVEDCVACRYVWLQVEMDVGNSQIEENIYDSFYQNALEAQKAPIFYPGCQTMFDSIDDMIGDYMDGYTVNQLCENSLLCR